MSDLDSPQHERGFDKQHEGKYGLTQRVLMEAKKEGDTFVGIGEVDVRSHVRAQRGDRRRAGERDTRV